MMKVSSKLMKSLNRRRSYAEIRSGENNNEVKTKVKIEAKESVNIVAGEQITNEPKDDGNSITQNKVILNLLLW